MNDSQENAWYAIIRCRDSVSELQLDQRLLDYTIRVNGGAYKGCIASMRGTNNSYVIITSEHIDDARFRDKE